jgi:hypothetical protein
MNEITVLLIKLVKISMVFISFLGLAKAIELYFEEYVDMVLIFILFLSIWAIFAVHVLGN